MKKGLKFFNSRKRKSHFEDEFQDFDREYDDYDRDDYDDEDYDRDYRDDEDYDEDYDDDYERDDRAHRRGRSNDAYEDDFDRDYDPDDDFDMKYEEDPEDDYDPDRDDEEDDYPEDDGYRASSRAYDDRDEEDDDYESDSDYVEDDEDYDGDGEVMSYAKRSYEEDDYRNESDSDSDYSEDDYRADSKGNYREDDYADEEDNYPEDDRYYASSDRVYDDRDVDDYDSDRDYVEDDEDYDGDGEYPEDDRYYASSDRAYNDRDMDDYDSDRDYEDDYPEDDYPEDEYYEDDYQDNYYAGDARSSKSRGKKSNKRNRGRDNDRDRDREPFGILFFEKILHSSGAEKIAAVFAILLLAGAIVTGSIYMNVSNKTKEMSSFADVGSTLSDIEIVGESGLVAIADAEKAKALAAGMIEEEVEEEQVADDAEGVTIQMTVTSIKSDIKVKFINSETKKLVASVPFEISVVTPDGSKVTYNDDDKDGIIYKTNIAAGTYKITPVALSSEYSNYSLDTSTKSLTVKDTVEMKAVDVSNEVKKESQVNVAKEDTAVKTEVESKLQDTVEWVESTKTETGTSNDGATYDEIGKDKIEDPAKTANAGTGYKKLGKGRTTGASVEGSTQSSAAASSKTSTTTEDGSTESSKENGSGSQSAGDGAGTGSGSENGTGSGTQEPPKNKTMNLGKSTYEVKVGSEENISITDPSDAKLTIKSGSDCITLNGNTVKGVKPGTATITASKDGYDSAEITVNVKEADKIDITVSLDNSTIKINESVTLKVTGPSKYDIKQTGGTGKVEINGNTVKGTAKGDVKITVSADGYNPKEITITVQDADKKKFEVSTSDITVKVDEEIDIAKAIGLKNAPSDLKFESADKNIAEVVNNKNVKGKTADKSTTIKMTATGFEEKNLNVKVVAKSGEKVPMKITKVTIVKGQKLTLKSSKDGLAITLSSSNNDIVATNGAEIIGKNAGTATVTVKADKYQDATVEVTVASESTTLKDKEGNVVYVKDANGNFREATYNDYYTATKFYTKKAAKTYRYTGWQTIDGKTYFFDKNGNKVTGEQVIMGAKYTFNSEGELTNTAGTMGIDVSKWNGTIDWNAVKNSGVNFVIIRCGYRGSSAGALIEDSKFKSNIKGAQAAGLKVGVYFFTQAINEVEAVEEASMVISLIRGYNISYPVYLDVEASNGRGDKISASQRTANIKAFCGTIQNAGYRAGVYGNKTWLSSYMATSQLTNYRIWLAQYAAAPTYSATRYDMWQYSSKGRVSGISGNVDMNICY